MNTILSIALGFNIGVILILIAELREKSNLLAIKKEYIDSMEEWFEYLKYTSILPDDYPVFPTYLYRCDGKKITSEIKRHCARP
jgi:hypothetical protein